MASGKVFLREVTEKLSMLGVSKRVRHEFTDWIKKRWGQQVLRLPCWFDQRRNKPD